MDRSPFPGMDPYLERAWRDTHGSLITYARDSLNRQLRKPLRARAEERVFVETDDDTIVQRSPDVFVVEHPSQGTAGAASTPSAAMVASAIEPIVIRLSAEPTTERFLEIVDAESGDRVVTVIEFLSPTNKRPGEGQDVYLAKRREYRLAGANLVEIDLTRAGSRAGLVPARKLPPSHRSSTYLACVRRADRPNELSVYAIPLAARLPKVAVPLRSGDAEIQLDLQSLVDQVWQNGRYDMADYARPLDPPLKEGDAAFAEDLLRKAGVAT